jgi:hypothetical protein
MSPFNQNSGRTLAQGLSLASLIIGGVAWVVLGLGGVIFGVGMATQLAGGSLQLPFGTALSEGVPLSGFIVALSMLLAMAPGVIFICDQLRRILATLIAGDPFVPGNASRLARIAGAIAAMELARYAIGVLAFLLLQAEPDYAPPRLVPNFAAWVGVVVLLVLAQVFSEGTRLREDQKMTI